jgi:hypothetical protein
MFKFLSLRRGRDARDPDRGGRPGPANGAEADLSNDPVTQERLALAQSSNLGIPDWSALSAREEPHPRSQAVKDAAERLYDQRRAAADENGQESGGGIGADVAGDIKVDAEPAD